MLIVNWDTVAVDGVMSSSLWALNGVAVEEGTCSVRTILDEVVNLE